jgi:hypothetical protein
MCARALAISVSLGFWGFSTAHSASVRGAHFWAPNSAKIDVMFSGGCGDHDFKLSLLNYDQKLCPEEAQAALVEISKSGDQCGSIVLKTITVPIPEFRGICRPTTLIIRGDEATEVSIKLEGASEGT